MQSKLSENFGNLNFFWGATGAEISLPPWNCPCVVVVMLVVNVVYTVGVFQRVYTDVVVCAKDVRVRNNVK